MSLQFVFGPAGAGKSTYVQQMLIDEAAVNLKDNYLLIVPDQFTMQTQMDIVKQSPNRGILNIDVLSFGRLSYRVFSVTGKNEVPVLDDTGKSLVLRRVAMDVAEKMPYIGRHLNKVGYIHEVKSQISEFMQYGLSVKDVEALSKKVNNELLGQKLSDLSVIYDAFMTFNKDKFVTSEETLDILRDKLSQADFIKGSTIVFDGFTGFTPIQARVVLELCRLAKKVIITFDLSNPEKPSEEGGREKLFFLSRKGAITLKNKALDLGITVDPDIVMNGENGRFRDKPEFSHLEKSLFRFPVNPYAGKVDNIELFSCHDIESEVSEILLKIHELVRTGNYAYKDFAVVTGNLESYGFIFENRCRELGIPVFIDRTNAIVLNPFTEYLKSSLRILEKDYSYDSVMHYLRSGFTDFDEDEIDRFDRYISSLNIRGKSAYHKEFKKREKGLRDKEIAESERLIHDAMRIRMIESLSILERPSETAGDYARNLYEFLKQNNSYEKLNKYEAFFNEKNNLSKAKEYGQIYKCMMELLDTIVALIGDEKMDLEEFIRIFEAGIGEIEVGTIPKNVDRIVIGDIERTRIGEIKVLFFAGVNDGNIPKSTDKGGILSMVDRESLLNEGYELAPTPREEMYTQRLYLYMNLLKPTDKLFVSFSGTGIDGKGMRPSYLIDVLCKLFPALKINSIEKNTTVNSLISAKDSLRFYAGLLRDYVNGSLDGDAKKISEALCHLYKEENINLSEDIEDAAFFEYVAYPLSDEIVRLIYGERIRASISRMELFAGCAYSHFLKYGMELKKNAEYEFAAADLGSVYHGVLDAFSTLLESKGLNWNTFTEEEGESLVEEAVRIYCEDYEQGILSEDAKARYTITKITKIMQRTIKTLQFHVKRGRFSPEGHEYYFERELSLKNNKKMLLNGKIDRIDICENAGKVYVKILDYKSSERTIDITNVYHGIEQQLAVYMKEAMYREKERHPGKEIVPSAMLYYALSDPMISVDKETTDEELDGKIKKELKVKGIVEASDENISLLDEEAKINALVLPIEWKKDGDFTSASQKNVATTDELNNMLEYVGRLIESIGDSIYSGSKRISPMSSGNKDSCKYCDYSSICRFDEKIPGYEKRDGKEIDEDKARDIVFGGDSDGLYIFS